MASKKSESTEFTIPPAFRPLLTLQGHTSYIYSTVWAPDGYTLASGSADGTIRLWDSRTGQTLRTLQGHTETVWSVAWAPDGYTLASGSDDRTIRLWDTRSGQEMHILEGHTEAVDAISFSLINPFLASRSKDWTIRIWHTGTWKEVATLKTSGISLPWSLAFHPTTFMLAAPDISGQSINIWGFDPTLLLGELAALPFEAL